ncbi:MAG: hypothetical protein GWP10_16955 [Nitrospiraceae bacterium]|nr:hypothetical protein [Nitrospiraceae bacterium]
MAETEDSTVSILIKLTVLAVIAAVVLTATYGVTQEELQRRAALLGGPGKQLRVLFPVLPVSKRSRSMAKIYIMRLLIAAVIRLATDSSPRCRVCRM